MKKIFLCLLLIGLVGCSSKEKTTVCTLEQEGVKIVNTLVSNGDEVEKQTILNEIEYSTLDMKKEDLENILNLYKDNYDLEGLEYSFDLGEEKVTETIAIDYNNVDLEKLMNTGLIESVEDAKYISLKITLNTLEESGFVCE